MFKSSYALHWSVLLRIKLYHSGLILTVCEVHDNAQLSLLGLEDFDELYYVRMGKCLQYLCLLYSFSLFLLAHLRDVNRLHHTLQLQNCHAIEGHTLSEALSTRKAFPKEPSPNSLILL